MSTSSSAADCPQRGQDSEPERVLSTRLVRPGGKSSVSLPDPSRRISEKFSLKNEFSEGVRLVRPKHITLGAAEICGIAVLLLALTARFIPLARILPSWGCPFRRITGGWPCLSCGMTRSFDWFIRGRFADAFLINPLGFLFVLSGALFTLYALFAPFRPPRLSLNLSLRTERLLAAAAVMLFFGNWAFLLIRHALGLWPV